MRKSRRRGSGRSAAQVDLVPMIDIVFQLLYITGYTIF